DPRCRLQQLEVGGHRDRQRQRDHGGERQMRETVHFSSWKGWLILLGPPKNPVPVTFIPPALAAAAAIAPTTWRRAFSRGARRRPCASDRRRSTTHRRSDRRLAAPDDRAVADRRSAASGDARCAGCAARTPT